MSDESCVVVIKARDYKMTPRMLDAIADEWVGFRAEMASGGLDDIHYEFQLADHADGFRQSIRAYKI